MGGPAAGRFGDYDQPDSLATAYEGLDHLLIIPTTDMPPGAFARQSVAAIDAAAAAGAGRIVIVSSTGTLTVSEPHILASYRGPADELRRIS